MINEGKLPHKPLFIVWVWPVKWSVQEQPDSGSVHSAIQHQLCQEAWLCPLGNVHPEQEVWNDEVAELEQLLGEQSYNTACCVDEDPEESKWDRHWWIRHALSTLSTRSWQNVVTKPGVGLGMRLRNFLLQTRTHHACSLASYPSCI